MHRELDRHSELLLGVDARAMDSIPLVSRLKARFYENDVNIVDFPS